MNKLKKVSYESEYTFIFFGHVLDLYDPVSYKTGSYKKKCNNIVIRGTDVRGDFKGFKNIYF